MINLISISIGLSLAQLSPSLFYFISYSKVWHSLVHCFVFVLLHNVNKNWINWIKCQRCKFYWRQRSPVLFCKLLLAKSIRILQRCNLSDLQCVTCDLSSAALPDPDLHILSQHGTTRMYRITEPPLVSGWSVELLES